MNIQINTFYYIINLLLLLLLMWWNHGMEKALYKRVTVVHTHRRFRGTVIFSTLVVVWNLSPHTHKIPISPRKPKGKKLSRFIDLLGYKMNCSSFMYYPHSYVQEKNNPTSWKWKKPKLWGPLMCHHYQMIGDNTKNQKPPHIFVGPLFFKKKKKL